MGSFLTIYESVPCCMVATVLPGDRLCLPKRIDWLDNDEALIYIEELKALSRKQNIISFLHVWAA